jgi:ketosteroid isomerase-like protein
MNTKRLLATLTMLILTASLFLAACAPAAPAKEMMDPVTVVKSFYEAYNANEIEKAMSLTASDYVMNDPSGTYDRTAAGTQWQAVRDSGITFNQSNFVDTGNGRVTSCYEVLADDASVDKGCGNVTHVRDGKIVYDGLENAEQIWVVQKYYEALNEAQFDKMATFMADDMVVTYPGGKTSGKQEIITANRETISAGLTFELSELKNTNGRVTSCFKVLQKDTLIDQGCTGVTIVRRGQIIFDGLAPDEPEYVVQRYYQALKAKDVELAMSFVASNALFINPTGTYEGADAIRESLAGLNTDGITFDLSNFRNTDGRIIYDYKVMQGGNLLDQGTNGLTIVEDGWIVFDGVDNTASLSPEEVVQGFWDAINNQDFATAMSLVSDDIKCRGTVYMTGKNSFQTYIVSSYQGTGSTLEISNLVVEGGTVTYDWRGYHDGFFQLGGTGESMTVENGVIVLFQAT